MARTIKKGATDQSVYIEVLNSSSTTGGRLTGLVFNSASLTAYYVRNGGSATAITLATLAAANSAHSDGGFKEVDATNMPGIYRLDLPDAAVATGAESVVITLKGATNMAQVSTEVQLVDNTSADVYSRVGAPAGASVSADIAAVKTETASIQSDTNDIQTRLPAALVSGRIDASVGAMAANVLTSTAIATDAITAAKIAADAIGASELAADAVTEIQSGLSTLDAAGVRSAVGLATANLDTQLAAIDDFLDTEIAAIKAKTDNLPSDPADASDILAALTAIDDYVDTEVAAIKVVTDRLDTAMENDGGVYRFTTNALEQSPAGGGGGLDAAGVRAAIGMASANMDTQLSGISSKTVNLPASPAATGDDMGLASSAVDLIHDEVVEGSTTMRQLMRGFAAVLLGKSSGLATATAIYRDVGDTKDRITATVDSNGNRSAITRDLT